MQPLIPHYIAGWSIRAQLSQFAEPMPGRDLFIVSRLLPPLRSPIALLRRGETPYKAIIERDPLEEGRRRNRIVREIKHSSRIELASLEAFFHSPLDP